MDDLFIWENFDDPRLRELIKISKFDDIMQREKDSLKKKIILKELVHKTLPNGKPQDNYFLKRLSIS
jgi:hypothetical protein